MAKRRSFRKKRVLKKKRRRSSNVARVVQRVIARSAEVKNAELYVASNPLTYYTGINFAVVNNFALSPLGASSVTIQQGVSASGRIGNKIRLKSLMFKGVLSTLPYDAVLNPTPQPVYVIMWIFSTRENPTVLTAPNATFLELGGSSTALTGRLIDTIAPVNKYLWKVYKKRVFKIGYAYDGATGGQLGSQYFANNDFKFSQSFSINVAKYCPKTIMYNDNVSTPSTRLLQVGFQCVNADNSLPASTSETPVNLSYTLSVRFTDM